MHLSHVKDYPERVRHLRPRIDANVLSLPATAATVPVSVMDRKDISKYFYPDSAVVYLTNAFHTPRSFEKALILVSEKLDRKHKLDEILLRTARKMVRVATSVRLLHRRRIVEL